jgi:hypothetical protein
VKSFPFALLLTALLGATLAPAQAQKLRTNDAYTLELLRRTLEEQQRNPDKVIRTATNLPPAAAAPVPVAPSAVPASPELAELERQYLAGKLSAKQYQKAVEQAQKKAAGKPLATPAISPKAAAASGVKVVAPEPMIATPPPAPNPNLQKLSDVDQKIEELLQRNRERAKAAAAAAAALPTSNPNGAPLSKRQRLDLLLRQVVEGKMTDEEYKAARAKIAAEPD